MDTASKLTRDMNNCDRKLNGHRIISLLYFENFIEPR